MVDARKSYEQGARHASNGASEEFEHHEGPSQEEKTNGSELAHPRNDGKNAGTSCQIQSIQESGQESAA